MFLDLEFNPTHLENKMTKYGKGNPVMKEEIIQIALILTDDKFEVIKKYNAYIKLNYGKDISDRVSKVIAYDKQFLDCNGIPFVKAVQKIYSLVAPDKLVYKKARINIVTFSGADEVVLKENLRAYNRKFVFWHNYVDAQVLFANKYNFYTKDNRMIHKNLLYCCDYVGVHQDEEYWHDAEYDVLLLYRLVKKMFQNDVSGIYKSRQARKKCEKYKLKGIS